MYWVAHLSSSSLLKYFCACVRTCSLERVFMVSAIFFHDRPYLSYSSRNTSCSSFVQCPSCVAASDETIHNRQDGRGTCATATADAGSGLQGWVKAVDLRLFLPAFLACL